MANHPLNAVNRGVYISDKLPFLQALNDECIDPPFANNETFGRKNEKSPDPLKPPLAEQERDIELTLLQRWGIRNEADANAAGIDWPATRYKDFWSWADIQELRRRNIEDDYPLSSTGAGYQIISRSPALPLPQHQEEQPPAPPGRSDRLGLRH